MSSGKLLISSLHFEERRIRQVTITSLHSCLYRVGEPNPKPESTTANDLYLFIFNSDNLQYPNNSIPAN